MSLSGNNVVILSVSGIERDRKVPWLVQHGQQGLTAVEDAEGTGGTAGGMEMLRKFDQS